MVEPSRTYTFDAWNRIATERTTGSGTNSITYQYDALGERTIENNVAASVSTSLFYAGSGQLVEEWRNGVLTYQYVWSRGYINDMVLRDHYVSGTVADRGYVLHDRNHNVTSIENVSGTIAERYLYDPFGFIAYLSPSYVVNSGTNYDWHYLYQGGRLDRTTNLYSFGARDYNPWTARWQERDPLGLDARDNNIYRAFSGNPIGLTDPSGLVVGHNSYGGLGPDPGRITYDPKTGTATIVSADPFLAVPNLGAQPSFWDDFWRYSDNPGEMDRDVRYWQIGAYGIAAVFGVAAIGVAAAAAAPGVAVVAASEAGAETLSIANLPFVYQRFNQLQALFYSPTALSAYAPGSASVLLEEYLATLAWLAANSLPATAAQALMN